MIKRSKLPNEFKVGLLILDLEHPATLSDIVIMLMNEMTPQEASIVLDCLDNIGLTKEKFVKRGEHQIRQISLSSEGTELFKITKKYIEIKEEFERTIKR